MVISLGLGVKTATAASINWIGSTDNNWGTATNWSSGTIPTSTDDVSIGSASVTVDVATAQCSTLTISGATTLTLSASNSLVIGGAITLNAALTTTGTGSLNAGGLIAGTYSLTNSGTTIINGNISFGINGYISNTSGGIFNITGSAISMDITSYISNASGATFTVNGGSSIRFINGASTAPSSSNIRNSGTFYAGTSNSIFIINLDQAYASIANGGNFYVGSTSTINLTGLSTFLTNTGTFTFKSDVNGSASIGNITGSIVQFFGTYSVERYITGGTGYRGYRLLSSPVYAAADSYSNNVYSINYLKNSCYLTGTTGIPGGFDQAGNPTLYLFRENLASSNATFTSGNFRGINTINNAPTYTMDIDGGPFNIPVGNGYLFFFRGDKSLHPFASEATSAYTPTNTTLTATGTLNTGSVTVHNWYTPNSANLGYTSTTGSSASGFNLVGNPYPSSIDWDKYNVSDPTTGIFGAGLTGFIYVLSPGTSGNYNVYQAGFSGAGTISSHSNIIPSGQGFFVTASSPNPQLTFNESAKTATQVSPGNSNLFLGTPPQAVVTQYLHLMLQRGTINADGTLISFNSNAKSSYVKGEDAPYKVGYGPASLSSTSTDGIPLAINTLALPSLKAQSIPLNVSASTTGVYHLNLTDIKSIPDLYDVWLMDAYKKDSLDIKHNPTYAFNINKSDASSYGSKRFTLVIRQNPALGVHLLNFTATKATVGAQIVWKTENEENYTNFTVERSTDGGVTYDVLDGLVSSAQGTYSFVDKTPLNNTANLYVLKLVDLNGTVTYSHVVTLMYGNLTNTIAGNIKVYPNPSNGVINLSVTSANSLTTFHPGTTSIPVTQNTSSISYAIKIIDITGSVIKTATSTSANWQADVTSLTPGTYIIQVLNNSDKSLVGKSTFIKL
ncbi:MAG: Cadherin-like beta sandwich domain protein [Mucilaginibacter sp.]|nr:Cadherin-like beta sandwich domain protein [Mucilaginibacter sp.]